MDRRTFGSTVRRLIVLAAVGTFGAAALVVGSVRRDALRAEAWAPLWPRPDGSVRSYGEVWDLPDELDTAAG
jgi:hypothetical protein